MATLNDIATRLNVSTGLVSGVLNGKSVRTRDETRRRIIELARELDYRPSAAARALVTGRTMQIAVALQMKSHHGYSASQVVAGLTEAAGERGYRVVMVPLRDGDNGRQIEELVEENVCDGVCLFSAMSDTGHWNTLRARRVPTVVIGDLPDEVDVTAARFAIRADHDNYHVGRDATAWLMRQGFERIAWVHAFGEAEQPHALELRRGYADALRAKKEEPVFLSQTPFLPPSEVPSAQLETALSQGIDAVLVRGLPNVLEWLRALQIHKDEAGRLQVMALVDAGNLWLFRYAAAQRKIACLAWDDRTLGSRAADALIDWIESGTPQTHHIALAPGKARWMDDTI